MGTLAYLLPLSNEKAVQNGLVIKMTGVSKIWTGIGVAGAIIIAGGAVIYATSPAGHSSGDLAFQLKGARQEGLWTTWQEIPTAKDIPAAENAGPIYTVELPKVKRRLGKDQKSVFAARDAIVSGKSKPTDFKTLRRGLIELEPILKNIERASELPHCVFQRDWNLGCNVLFPEFAYMKDVAKLFAARAVLETSNGQTARAEKSIAIACHLARHTGEERILIAGLVQAAIEATIDRSLERMIDAHPTDLKVLAIAKEAVADFGPPISMRHVLGTALPMVLATMDSVAIDPKGVFASFGNSGSKDDHDPALALMEALASFGPIRDALKANLIEYSREINRQLPRDDTDYDGATYAMRKEEKKLDADKRWNAFLTKLMAPVYSQAADGFGQSLALRRVRLAQIAVLEANIKTGAYPEKLASLGTVPIDPFGKEPLVYKRTLSGFKVYSVGRDRVDDGGRVRNVNTQDTFDLVASYPAPVRVKLR